MCESDLLILGTPAENRSESAAGKSTVVNYDQKPRVGTRRRKLRVLQPQCCREQSHDNKASSGNRCEACSAQLFTTETIEETGCQAETILLSLGITHQPSAIVGRVQDARLGP